MGPLRTPGASILGSPLADLSFSTRTGAPAAPKSIVRHAVRLVRRQMGTLLQNRHNLRAPCKGFHARRILERRDRGTFRGLTEKIPYRISGNYSRSSSADTGNSTRTKTPSSIRVRANGLKLLGIRTFSFFARRDAILRPAPPRAVRQFKECARLSQRGIEVILDIVFNPHRRG